MKFSKFFIALFAVGSVVAGASALNAVEEDHGLVVIDRKPWKTSWVQESNQWILITHFEKGELRTYFKKAPPSKGLGIDPENRPLKQELKYYPSGKTYTSKLSQFEQWPDGARAWAFSYDDAIKLDDDQFTGCTTAIIQESSGASDEIRYSLFKILN